MYISKVLMTRMKSYVNLSIAEMNIKNYGNILKLSKDYPGHLGVHAAGVVIAPDNLTNHIPLAISPKDKTIITQYDGKCLEKLGLLKIDCLGLKNLTIIERALQLIKKASRH